MTSSAQESGPLQPVRVGIVGCGRLTKNKHLKAIRTLPEIECVALADLDPGALEAVADQYEIGGRYEDLQGLLTHPGIDAVGLIVPTKIKAKLAVTALAAGKPALLEKPVADSLDGIGRMRAVAGKSALAIPGFNIVFHRLVQDALRRVRCGEVGEVESIRTLWYSPWLNKAEHGNVSHAQMRHRHGEGAFTDLGSQCFDLWRRFSGSEVETLWAQCIDGGAEEDVGTVSARMVNGVLATGTFSTRTSHEIEIEICGDRGRLRVGALRFDGIERLPLSMIPGSGGHRAASLRTTWRNLKNGWKESRTGGAYQASIEEMWAHFADVVRGRTEPFCSFHDGCQAFAITQAAQESARTGLPVQPGSLVAGSIRRAS